MSIGDKEIKPEERLKKINIKTNIASIIIIVVVFIYMAFRILSLNNNAQVDSTDWKVLEAIEIALKYTTNESNSPYDLLYRSPQMVLQESIEYLDQKEKDIEYLKEIRREYIEKLRKQNHKR